MMLIKHPLPYSGKYLLLPYGRFLQSKPLLQKGIRRDTQSYLLHFLIIFFHFFTQQSALHAGRVRPSFR